MNQKVTIPGQLLSENKENANFGTYIKDNKLYSCIFGIVNDKNKISVTPFKSKYLPSYKDFIIGIVINVTPMNWIFDINSPYNGLLHVSEYPKRIESSKMPKLMGIGDAAILRIVDVSIMKKVELTMKEGGLGCILEGRILTIPSSKVFSIIGHDSNIISMLRSSSECDIFVGRNGRIWINGPIRNMNKLENAIDYIVENSEQQDLIDIVAQLF